MHGLVFTKFITISIFSLLKIETAKFLKLTADQLCNAYDSNQYIACVVYGATHFSDFGQSLF